MLRPREIKAILERVSGDAGHARHLLAAAGSLPEKNMLTVWSRTSPALDAGGAYALEGNHQRECPPRVDDGRGWSRRHIAVPVLHVVPFPKFHTADSEAGSADAGVQSGNAAPPTEYRNEFGGLFSGYRKLTERIETLYASLEQRL